MTTGDCAVMENLPGTFDNPSGNTSFADGHVLTHKWLDRRTVQPLRRRVKIGLVPAKGNRDLAWLQTHATRKKTDR
jgi:prepilin-type processing-associated H-X9-DG protein